MDAQDMPRYRSHKEVRALKIKLIELMGPNRWHLTFDEPGHVPKDDAWMKKFDPQIGGYYVVYADGYSSYSPAQAFEEGYTLISEAKDASFREQLRESINRASRENASNTPDFILAQYLLDSLRAYEYATRRREQHAGRFKLHCADPECSAQGFPHHHHDKA